MNLDSLGFLNLGASMGQDIALIGMLAVGIILTFGVVMAIRKKYEIHRYAQTIGVVLSAILVFWLMVPEFLGGHEELAPDKTGENKLFEILILTHVFFGTIAVLLGIFITLRANGLVPRILQFQKYKPAMRISYCLYMIAILLGVWVYVVMPERVMA